MVVHKTHYSLENFRGASAPCHYVLCIANDSRGKLSQLAKNRESFPPQKFCRIRYFAFEIQVRSTKIKLHVILVIHEVYIHHIFKLE